MTFPARIFFTSSIALFLLLGLHYIYEHSSEDAWPCSPRYESLHFGATMLSGIVCVVSLLVMIWR